jgi:hypothetical protein
MTPMTIVALVAGALVICFGAVVLWDVFVPKICAQCGRRGLKCLNFVRADPGPNYSTFRCAECGEEFVQVHGKMELRKGSKWEGEFGW